MMKTTIILHSEALGRGSDELGKTMTGSFLRKLWASDKKPDNLDFPRQGLTLLHAKPVSGFMKSKRRLSSVESSKCRKSYRF